MQCAKQPYGSKACGLYTCAHLRQCKAYNTSWKKLKEAIEDWRQITRDKLAFKQIKADICKFLLENCVREGQEFFDNEGDLAVLPEFEKFRKWDTMLRPTDYKHQVEVWIWNVIRFLLCIWWMKTTYMCLCMDIWLCEFESVYGCSMYTYDVYLCYDFCLLNEICKYIYRFSKCIFIFFN